MAHLSWTCSYGADSVPTKQYADLTHKVTTSTHNAGKDSIGAVCKDLEDISDIYEKLKKVSTGF